MADPKSPHLQQNKTGGMPTLLRFLALNLGIGIGLGVAFAALLILANVGGLKTVIAASAAPYFAVFLLYFMCALTFGALAMGAAIMLLPYPPPGEVEGGRDTQNYEPDGSGPDAPG